MRYCHCDQIEASIAGVPPTSLAEDARALGHDVAAALGVDDDARQLELRDVVVVRRDLDRLRRERAMADRRRCPTRRRRS